MSIPTTYVPESVEAESPNEESESDDDQTAKTQAVLPKPKIKQLSTQPPTAPSKVSQAASAWTKADITGEKLVDRQGNIQDQIKTQQRSWQFQNDMKWNLILDEIHKHNKEKVIPLQHSSTQQKSRRFQNDFGCSNLKQNITADEMMQHQQVSTVSNDYDLYQGELFYNKEEIVTHIPPE